LFFEGMAHLAGKSRCRGAGQKQIILNLRIMHLLSQCTPE
jgi:hypothetical protein